MTRPRLIAGGAAVLVAAALLPPVQARAKAAFVVAEALGLELPRPFAARVTRTRTEIGGVRGDLYLPAGPAPAMILVPGAAPKGPDDARAVRLAFALARAGRVVFVPEMALAQRTFVQADIEALVSAALALGGDDRTTGRPLFVGISYGGSFALIAAADPRLEGRIEMVATFGAYYDLVGVAQAVTTGVSVVENRRVPWRAHPDATTIFREVIIELAPEQERRQLRRALDGDVDAERLSDTARRIYDFATNEDPALTDDLAARLPDDMRDMLARFSPATVAHRIDVPVVALHSTDDPVVPYGEGVRLDAGIAGTRLVKVALFEHVDVEGPGIRAVPDLLRVWAFTSWTLGAQE